MPWEIKKQGDKWLVVKKDGGKVIGTHPTEAAAKKHLAALYVNVKEIENIDVNFVVPTESFESISEGEVQWLQFGGTCLKPTISRNDVKYTIENIKEMDGKKGKFFVTHVLDPDNCIGHVSFAQEGDEAKYHARIRNTVKHADIIEAVKDKRVDVSIDCRFKKVWKEDDNGKTVYRVLGLEPRGLCAVGIGGVAENSIDYAIAEEFKKIDEKIEQKTHEVLVMEEEQMQKLLKENEEMKAKLIAIETDKKSKLVEQIVALNKELDAKKLMEREMNELQMIFEYESKLAKVVEKEKETKNVGASEVKETEVKVEEKEDIVIEQDGSLTMNSKMYDTFNNEIRKKLVR